MRLALFSLLLLAACGTEPSREATNAAAPERGEAAQAEPDNRIECMSGSARRFERTCTIDIAQSDEGAIFTLRKPDGGFRRILQTPDGFQAADGAEPARATPLPDGRVEIEIGADRFRFGWEWQVTSPPELQGR